MTEAVFLMYHELARAGRPLCDDAPGYTRYVVSEATFADHLARLNAFCAGGKSVSRALEQGGVAVTFDDGCETDLLIAAPLLRAAGCGATFFLVSDWVGRPGFLSAAQIRQLIETGFEIGSHGQSHAFLSDLPDAEVRAELRNSKRKLEDISGEKIAHFSCPGGRFDARVALIARELGYASVSTSRSGKNGPHADRFSLARMAITTATNNAAFERACRGELGARDKVRGAVLGAAKSVLGNGAYQKMRGAALEKSGA